MIIGYKLKGLFWIKYKKEVEKLVGSYFNCLRNKLIVWIRVNVVEVVRMVKFGYILKVVLIGFVNSLEKGCDRLRGWLKFNLRFIMEIGRSGREIIWWSLKKLRVFL